MKILFSGPKMARQQFFAQFFSVLVGNLAKTITFVGGTRGNCIIAAAPWAARKELIETARIPALAAGQKIEQKIGPKQSKTEI
jgi:hypothetical protein